ncbi:LysR family transcriptional regulator [Brevundimonas intermedia]|uniref:LysR family transcriptional regulator n=1 Tax=Brevundimonas intermedia TaxID=74315 RepID=UPI00320B8D47
MDRLDCDRIFVAVVEARSFTQAARQIGVSPGQASKMITRLEDQLGVQLLMRTTRAVAPSDAGRAYYERIRDLLDEFEALDSSVRNASGTAAGRIRLSAPETFGITRLAPVLMDFAAHYPDIQLDVRFADRRVSLVDEGFDLAVRIGNPGDSSLMSRRLCEARIVTVAARSYLERRSAPTAPQDLVDHDCIIDTNFSEPLIWPYRVEGVTAVVGVKGRLRLSNAQACLIAAQSGQGVARLPTFVAGEALRDGGLVAVLRDYEPEPLGVFALYPAGRAVPRKVRVLIDHLVDAFAGKPDWDMGWDNVSDLEQVIPVSAG